MWVLVPLLLWAIKKALPMIPIAMPQDACCRQGIAEKTSVVVM